MKAIFHVGMSKTGTSSIQRSFVSYNHPDILYPNIGQERQGLPSNGNHSRLTVLLFTKNPELHPGFKARGFTEEQVIALKRDTQRELIHTIQDSSAKSFLMSSEHISSMPYGICGKVKNFAERYFDDYEIIAYVRPPISYMTSVFQQRLKGNLRDLELTWPNYRYQLEKFDKIFGEGKVTFKKFDKETLHKGDVVSDLANHMGIDIPQANITRSNKSLSLEATSLLFVQRKYGQGFEQGSDLAAQRNYLFTDLLRSLGHQKLQFENHLFTKLIEENEDDLKWIEDRLGVPVLDDKPKLGIKIGSADDFVDMAWKSNKVISKHLVAAISEATVGRRKKLVQNIELYRSLAPYLRADITKPHRTGTEIQPATGGRALPKFQFKWRYLKYLLVQSLKSAFSSKAK